MPYAPRARYNGAYQHIYGGGDWSVYYVGGGTDNGKLAAPYYFFDNVLSFLPAAVVFQNGHWMETNQNGDVVMTAQQAASNLNETMFRRVLVASDFSTNAAATGATVLVPNARASGTAAAISTIVAPSGMMVTLDGSIIAKTMVLNGHTWTATSEGTFTTTADLATEWKGYLAQMQAGNGTSMTAVQRMEANAEVIFENTAIATSSAQLQSLDRMAVQRELDAMAAAIQIDATTLGIDPTAVLVQGSYLALERTLQSNAALEELAVQGHGLTSPPSGRYTGYVGYFKKSDSQTKYWGSGTDYGQNALSVLFGDSIAACTPFAVVWHNGKLVQLDQNGAPVTNALGTEIAALNDTMYNRLYKAADFHK